MRTSAGLSMKELGRRVGTDAGHISRWEHGTVRPTADYLFAVAEATGYEVVIKPKYNKNYYLKEKKNEQTIHTRETCERPRVYPKKKQ